MTAHVNIRSISQKQNKNPTSYKQINLPNVAAIPIILLPTLSSSVKSSLFLELHSITPTVKIIKLMTCFFINLRFKRTLLKKAVVSIFNCTTTEKDAGSRFARAMYSKDIWTE